MDQPVECPLCGLPVQFSADGACHQGPTQCTAEGLAKSEADLFRLADLLFGASGVAYRDISEARRMDGFDAGILKSVALFRNGHPSPWFRTGDDVVVRVRYEGARPRHSYIALYLLNDLAERMATIHSTHQRDHAPFPERGTVECRIERLSIGEGTYHLMVDYGVAPPPVLGVRPQPISMDCVPNAATIRVRLDGFLGGVGLNAFEGAAMRSVWAVPPA